MPKAHCVEYLLSNLTDIHGVRMDIADHSLGDILVIEVVDGSSLLFYFNKNTYRVDWPQFFFLRCNLFEWNTN